MCIILRQTVEHCKIQDRTLLLPPELQKVHKTPFPNNKKDTNKVIVLLVIYGNTSDMEMDESAIANSTFVPAAVRTLWRSLKIYIYIYIFFQYV